MKITVVALGKIGLPLAVQFASMGHEVTGADVNAQTVEQVASGVEPFPGESGLQDRLSKVVAEGRLRATTDTAAAVAESEAVVLVVPLFVDADGVPDFGWMDAATRDVARGLRPGTLVSYETTLPVGTTRGRFGPMLEEGSGLTAGVDFHLVFSPERVFTGRVFADLARYPKLVGGVDEASGERGVQFTVRFSLSTSATILPSRTASGISARQRRRKWPKLAETTYRDVNIGLANQFARFAAAHGIDVYQVIEARNRSPSSHIHQPGIAVGGHCIPIYPRMYLWNDPAATVVRAARKQTLRCRPTPRASPPTSMADLDGVRVAGSVPRIAAGSRRRPSLGSSLWSRALRAQGAAVAVNDPMYSDDELIAMGFDAFHVGEPAEVVIVRLTTPNTARSGRPTCLASAPLWMAGGYSTLRAGRARTWWCWASLRVRTHRLVGESRRTGSHLPRRERAAARGRLSVRRRRPSALDQRERCGALTACQPFFRCGDHLARVPDAVAHE